MKFSARTVIAIIAITVASTVYISGGGSTPNPFEPEKQRPILTAIARAAKMFLWLAFVADPPPEEYEPIQQTVTLDGYPVISHARSL